MRYSMAMSFVYIVGFLSAVGLELLLWIPAVWKARNLIAPLVMLATTLSTAGMAWLLTWPWYVVLAVVAVYRLVNVWRVLKGRTEANHLYVVARRASLGLIALQLVVLLLPWLIETFNIQTYGWYGVATLQFGFGLVLLASTLRHVQNSQPLLLERHIADRDLPTVTVGIPARNETDELVACLHSLLASNYPKLEIIVLDDCSQNSRTPELIRGFAHDGVRFVAGEVPPENWLAKNYAYHQLAKTANGELLLFCGVDTRFEPNTINIMVETLLSKNKSMMSVMPANTPPQGAYVLPLLTQPNRYAWEISLPRRWLNRPPVLSTCWLIKRKTLEDAGGLSAVAHGVIPERYFADYTVNHQDGYSFIISDRTMGLSSVKTYAEQRATAIRTRYPQLHRRLDAACLLTLLEAFGLLGPFVALGHAAWRGDVPAFAVSIMTCLLLIGLYVGIVRLTYRRLLLRSLLLMPVAALHDIAVLNYSMWQYEFGEVLWKGRNVCLPVMQVIPKLPKI